MESEKIWKDHRNNNAFLYHNDCFVSVFLTEREGYYIITDGGWISENYYNNFFDSDDESYLRLFTYYKEQYSIRETESNNKIYYYKTTMKKELVPNLVLEVSNFYFNRGKFFFYKISR